jgi:hypothetical protein
MMHHHTRRTLKVHKDRSGDPIPESVICCCCEDDAGNRMQSYRRAIDHGNFDSTPRESLAGGHCAFCGRKGVNPR